MPGLAIEIYLGIYKVPAVMVPDGQHPLRLWECSHCIYSTRWAQTARSNCGSVGTCDCSAVARSGERRTGCRPGNHPPVPTASKAILSLWHLIRATSASEAADHGGNSLVTWNLRCLQGSEGAGTAFSCHGAARSGCFSPIYHRFPF